MTTRHETPVPSSVPSPGRRPAQAGFTMVELLAAMAIFLGLAGMVMQVMSGGLNLWSSGEKSRHSRETGSVLLDRLEQELREMAACTPGGFGEPRVKLVCDTISQDPDGDGVFDFRSQRIVFVRNVVEQRTHPLLRTAGMVAGQGAYYEGQGAYWTPPPPDPDAQAVDETAVDGTEQTPSVFFLATEGQAEVCWVCMPDDRAGYEGRLVLWRALRSPIGGPESLFEMLEENGGYFPDGLPVEAMAENLLHLGFEFFDGTEVELSSDGGQGGPSGTWDSTRAILEAGEGPRAFRHAVGSRSLDDPDDDIFPQAIRISVVVEAPPGQAFEAELLEGLGAEDRGVFLRLRNDGFLNKIDATPLVARIGNEWVELGSPERGSVPIRRRGLYGSASSAHPAGTKLMVGRRFERVVRIPVARDPAPPKRRDEG